MKKVIINGLEYSISADQIAEDVITIKDEKINIFNSTELEKRDKAIRDDEYEKGKTVGVEKLAKDIKKKYSLEDIEGKDFDKIFDIFKSRILTDAKLEPSKRIEELEKDISTLQTTLKQEQDDKIRIQTEYQTKEKTARIENDTFNMIPSEVVSEKFTRKDVLVLFNANGYESDYNDKGQLIVKKMGETLKDTKTLEPLPVSDVLNEFLLDKGLLKKEGRDGDGDGTGSRKTTIDKFYKQMKDSGKNDEEINRELQSRIADGSIEV
jgi:RNAse (barnase) inhibitor barstar